MQNAEINNTGYQKLRNVVHEKLLYKSRPSIYINIIDQKSLNLYIFFFHSNQFIWVGGYFSKSEIFIFFSLVDQRTSLAKAFDHTQTSN